MATTQSMTDPYELAQALLDNSRALVDDADLLLEHGRHPRAAALALMAMEELSKVQLCLEAMTEGTPVPESRSKAWTDHRGKFSSARAFELAFLDESPDLDPTRVKKLVAEDQQTKLACLYVDHAVGHIARPQEFVMNTSLVVERAKNAVAQLGQIVALSTPDAVALIRPHQEVITKWIESLVVEGDAGATIDRLRALLQPVLRATMQPESDKRG